MNAFISCNNDSGHMTEQTHLQISFAQIFDLPLNCALESTKYRIPMIIDKQTATSNHMNAHIGGLNISYIFNDVEFMFKTIENNGETKRYNVTQLSALQKMHPSSFGHTNKIVLDRMLHDLSTNQKGSETVLKSALGMSSASIILVLVVSSYCCRLVLPSLRRQQEPAD